MNPKVSIIIPVYNAEKTLYRCVESLYYGLEKNIEIILIDDCSKDNSWKVCQEINHKYNNIIIAQNEKNSGVSFTRNHGLNIAKGKYVMFVDSDDWVSKSFVKEELSLIENNEDKMVTCGFHYVDQISNIKEDYIWNENYIEKVITIKDKQFFDAIDKIMLQNVWNKIFLLSIIKDNKIYFDESQTMGEDFEFVLDYMIAGNVNQCIIINKPLYYYLKANNTSLMGNFGWNCFNIESRFNKFKKICGDSEYINIKIKESILSTKNNLVYHVVRTPNKTKKEKINRIEEIFNDNKGKEYFNTQMKLVFKEHLKKIIIDICKFPKRLIVHLIGKIQNHRINKIRKMLNINNFTLISQNCIGGVVYHDMKKQFQSPTINLFIKQPDFINFVMNLKYYLSLKLEMSWDETYPIGKLGDIDIHFMHYSSCHEAEQSWNRRKKRVNFDKIVVISTDRDGFDESVFEKWKQIPYKKILFTSNIKFNDKDSVYFEKYQFLDSVPDLISKREFYKDNKLISKINK